MGEFVAANILFQKFQILVKSRLSLEREVRDLNLGLVKLDSVLPTARHRSDISLNKAVFPGRNDAEMGPTNS